MKPVGLMFKHGDINPFTGRSNGDLMIIHECIHCGKISPNRISGDDNTYMILTILDDSISIDGAMRMRLEQYGISMLTLDHKDDVEAALFGRR